MLFHVDMIYLGKQAKRGVEKSFEMRTVTKSNTERDSSVLYQNDESIQMFSQF